MSAYFVDTSALAKRYLVEPGSDWVISWIVPSARNTIIAAELAVVEMCSLLARRRREGSLDQERVRALLAIFLLHAEQEYLMIRTSSEVLGQARDLILRHPLRTLDAIQLACASRASDILQESVTFVSADRVLLGAAAFEGLTSADPNHHL